MLAVTALAATYPLQASAAPSAGVAQFIAGDVSIKGADGKATALAKGNALESGQAIVTGSTGRAQVKFSDGGLLSLQPNTEFRITNYFDKADPKEDRFIVDLLRGSMRAITGLIGKRNHDNYKVTTTTATIGIRGSAFTAGYNTDGSLSVTTELDAIEVCNAGGCVGLTAGESARVLNNNQAPVRTSVRAPVSTPDPAQQVLIAGNQTNTDGSPSILPTTSVTQVFTDLAVAAVYSSGGDVSTASYHPNGTSESVLTTLKGGKLTEFTDTQTSGGDGGGGDDGFTALVVTPVPATYVTQFKDGKPGMGTSGTLGKTTDADFVGWGSWVSGTLTSDGSSYPIESFHYVVGRPTPDDQIAALCGQTATYQFAGGTATHSTLGAGTLLGGELVANFSSSSGSLALNTSFGNMSSGFSINGAKISYDDGTRINGFFAGPQASRAAVVYSTPLSGGIVSGAAVFQNPVFTPSGGI
jgi:FecR protein